MPGGLAELFGARMRVRVDQAGQQPAPGGQLGTGDRIVGPPVTVGEQVDGLATAASTSAGTGSSPGPQSPMILAQPVRAAWAAATEGSSAWSARRPQPSKNWPCWAIHGPACTARGRS